MNAVVTTLLCSAPDPQRGERWQSDGTLLDTLAGSITGADLTVLADSIVYPLPHCRELRHVPAGANPYHHRWTVLADWLATCEAEWVWCVDATDVEMLHEPWGHMEPGVIYCGSEEGETWSCPWMVEHHPSIRDVAADQPLMNAGLLGGDVDTVRDFVEGLRAMLMLWPGDVTDMAAFNRAASFTSKRVVTGPQVHTRFRAEERTHPTAWFRHK